MAKIITQHRRGTTAEWEAAGVIPAESEIIVVNDNGVKKLKIGDGKTEFKDLPFVEENLENIVASLNTQLQQALAGQTPTLDGSWEKELQNIRVSNKPGAEPGTSYVYPTAGDAVRAIEEDLSALEVSLKDFINQRNVDGLEYTSDYKLYLKSGDTRIGEPVTIVAGSGGGGGGGYGSTVKFENLTKNDQGEITTHIKKTAGNPIILTFIFTSTDEDGNSTGDCSCTVQVDGTPRLTLKNVKNGQPTSINITDIVKAGENTVKLVLTDMYGNGRNPSFSVDVIDLVVTSTFNSYTVRNSDIDFRYRISGKIEKEVIFYINGKKINALTQRYSASVNNAEKSQIIPLVYQDTDLTNGDDSYNLSSGIHTLEVEAVAVSDPTIKSPKLRFDLLIDNGDNIPMIASVFNITTATQGDPLSIPFYVYDPRSGVSTCRVVLEIYTDATKTTRYSRTFMDVDEGQVTPWTTRNYPEGDSVYFRIAYYSDYTVDDNNKFDESKLLAENGHTIKVQGSEVDVDAAENPILFLSASSPVDKGNKDIDRDTWEFTNYLNNTIRTTFEGFNWNSNGWIKDTNGDTALRINGGANATINVFPFAGLSDNLQSHGFTMEMEFAIRDLNNRNASVISCCSESDDKVVGFKATADKAIFGSTQTTLQCRYKDNERVRVSFTVDQDDDSSSRFICCYLDGVLSGVDHFESGVDKFDNNMSISLGDDGCTLDFYSIRIYDRSLTAQEILHNFIFDNSNIATQLSVYQDNQVYKNNLLSYELVKAKIPTITFTGQMPKFKGDKRVVKMDFENPFDHTKDFKHVYGNDREDFTGIDVEIDVQGTSSQYYVRKNWKFKLKKKDKETGETIFNHEAYQHMDDEVPAKVFCIKVDYAEGTGTHNTQNANFAETLYTGKVPAQYDDSRVRTTVAGFPCVIFEKETDSSDPVFSSKSNFNFDKDAEEAFGFSEDYDVECWEFCNNIHDTVKFLAKINPKDWAENFEPRCYYPKYANKVDFDEVEDLQDLKDAENSTITASQLARLDELRQTSIDRFKRMHDWVVDTTGDVDRFRNEFRQHFDLEYSLVYYVYTFFALMTDQRAKNMFLTYWGKRVYINATNGNWMIGDQDTGKHSGSEPAPVPYKDTDGIEYFDINGEKVVAGLWYPYLYDNDTCYGIDNSGNMVFDYYHEDIDTWDSGEDGEKLVYNGQESVLWNNFRQAFANEIKAKYSELRSSGKLTYEKIYERFIDEGSEAWNASIYNEDAEFKYLSMARPNGNGINAETGQPNPPDYGNLYQVKGDGKQHLKYFLQNRFKYCDSKWHTGTYPTDIVYLRINSGSQFDSTITVTPFSNMYCGVQYGAGSSVAKERVTANVPQSFAYTGKTMFLYTGGQLVENYINLDSTGKPVSIRFNDVDYILTQQGDSTTYIGADSEGNDYLELVINATNTAATVKIISTQETISYDAEVGSGTPNDLETSIFGASELSSIGDLSKLYPSRIEFRKTNKLINLKLGDTNIVNTMLERFTLENCPLLQRIDITNCQKLQGDINCKPCTNIEEIEALGTNVSSVSVSKGGYVKLMHLPASITQLILVGQHALKLATVSDTEGLSIGSNSGITNDLKITNLCIEDCPDIDSEAIFQKCLSSNKLERVCLDDMHFVVDDWEIMRSYYVPPKSQISNTITSLPYYTATAEGSDVETIWKRNYQGGEDTNTGIPASVAERLDGKGLLGIDNENKNLDYINIKGTCIINQDMTGADMAELVKYFPAIKFSVGEGKKILSTVYFMNNDGTEVLYTKQVQGTDTTTACPDLTDEEKSVFVMNPSIKYSYALCGWSMNSDSTLDADGVPVRQPNINALNEILGDRVLYPAFSTTLRSYPVKFLNDGNTLLAEYPNVLFGTTADYFADHEGDPETEIEEFPELHPFAGWDPEPIVNADTIIYDEATFTGHVDVFAVYKTIDEQYEEPAVNELKLAIDETNATNIHILGRDEGTWLDEPNVFVRIPVSYNYQGQPRNVVSITGFNNFNEMQLISLPSTLTHIYSKYDGSGQVGAFEKCDNLTEVTIGPNVQMIDYHSFYDTPKLKKVVFAAKNAFINATQNNQCVPFAQAGGTTGFDLYITDSVESINEYMFNASTALPTTINKIVWPATGANIAINGPAFYRTKINGSQLDGDEFVPTLYKFPGGLTSIGNQAFFESIKEGEVTIELPSTLTSIGQSAFQSCTGIKGINIPEATNISVDSANPFDGCYNLTDISVAEDSTKYLYTSGCLIHKPTGTIIHANKNFGGIPPEGSIIGHSAFKGNGALNEIDLENVTKINTYAFGNCPMLTRVVMNNSVSGKGKVTEIGSQAFWSCANLKYLELSSELTTIPDYLAQNSGIISIVIPDKVTSLGSACFKNCKGLTEVVIPSSVTVIKPEAFAGCDSLTSVTFEDTAGWKYCIDDTSEGTPIDVTNPATNGSNLSAALKTYYWKKFS